MYYIVDFQICSLIIMIVVSGHFFSKFRFPLRQNKIFIGFMAMSIVQVICDVVSAYTISLPYRYPLWIGELFNIVNYVCLFVLPAIFFRYLSNVAQIKKTKNKNNFSIYFPTAILILLLLFNPVFPLFFKNSGSMFLKGPMFWALPFNLLYYIIACMVVISKSQLGTSRSKIHSIIYISIVCVILMGISATFTQYLLTGLATSISVVILYLSLQNPADMVDDLTCAYNKSSFLRYVSDMTSQNNNFSIVYINIDDTRVINNTFGLETGSMLLHDFAGYLKENTNKSFVFRISGDQFAVIVHKQSDCISTIEIIKKYFSTTHIINELDIKPSACMCYLLDMDRLSKDDELLVMMEYMMTKAKSLGRGTIFEVDDTAMKARQRELDITNAFNEAIDNESLEVYLQPIYSPKRKKFVSAEALCRFNHPILGFIPPDEFIRLSESNGMIVKIGLLVLKKVCVFLNEHPEVLSSGIECVEINLSAIELVQDDFAEKIMAVTNQYGIDPHLINFEITETVATTVEAYVKQNMSILKSHGFTFSLDDFGTGYSNLDSIIILPFSIIKIDRSMLLGYFENSRSATVFRNTAGLIKELNLEIVVEGAETEEHIRMLHELDVDLIQGYYYSRPIPMDQFVRFVLEKNNSKALQN